MHAQSKVRPIVSAEQRAKDALQLEREMRKHPDLFKRPSARAMGRTLGQPNPAKEPFSEPSEDSVRSEGSVRVVGE